MSEVVQFVPLAERLHAEWVRLRTIANASNLGRDIEAADLAFDEFVTSNVPPEQREMSRYLQALERQK